MSLQKSNFSSQNFPLADILVHKYFYLVNFLRYSVPLLMCGPTASLIVLRYVKTFFDQPAKKKKRYLRRKEKAARLAPRPIDLLRPAVSCMSIRYNMKIRKGRGFTPAELKVNHLLKTPKLYVPWQTKLFSRKAYTLQKKNKKLQFKLTLGHSAKVSNIRTSETAFSGGCIQEVRLRGKKLKKGSGKWHNGRCLIQSFFFCSC